MSFRSTPFKCPIPKNVRERERFGNVFPSLKHVLFVKTVDTGNSDQFRSRTDVRLAELLHVAANHAATMPVADAHLAVRNHVVGVS
jgi:hypothetical protein